MVEDSLKRRSINMSNAADSFFKGKELLLIEDDLLLRKRLQAKLENMGMEVTPCETLEEARAALASMRFEFALFDLNLPDGESLDLFRESLVPENTLTILMTGDGGVRSAVEAIRLGVADYLNKPFDLDELHLIFGNADNLRKNQRLIQHQKEQRRRRTENLFFDGSFRQDQENLNKILSVDRRLIHNLPPLLIDGPTGSGKSTYARWIHENGPRSDAPFIAVNCSAIPENLIESELFGHEKGAFTDARNARIGLFEAADGGTLFLDEIVSLSPSAQAKLLLAIENGRIRRVGGDKEIKVDARIIAAANQDLRTLIGQGQFREDLFHRLDLLRIKIPPLNARDSGIIALAEHFLSILAKKYKTSSPKLSPVSKTYLTNHSWPGNARELLHELERALVMGDPGKELEIQPSSNAPSAAASEDWLNESYRLPETGFELEKEMLRLIDLAIRQANGNVSEAARLLGVPRDYLRYRLKKSESS